MKITSTLLALLVAPLLVGTVGNEALAGEKAPCGLTYSPFVKGTVWNYEYIVPPGVEEKAGLKVNAPDTISITVEEVLTEKGLTTITLKESYRKVDQKVVLSCSKSGLEIPPQSFFFNGEPGGARGVDLAELKMTGQKAFPKGNLKAGLSLFTEIKGNVVRKSSNKDVKHPNARIEMERQLNVGGTEEVVTNAETYKAIGVEIIVSGRVFIESGAGKERNMPAMKSLMWFAKNVGLVQVYNRFGHGWRLVTKTSP